MKKIIIVISVLYLFSGCIHNETLRNPNPKIIQVPNQKVELFLGREDTAWENYKLIKLDEQLVEKAKTACKPQQIQEPKFVPVLAAGGKLLFDLYMDNKNAKLKKLKKAAQQSYSAMVITTTEDFANCKCAVLVRYDESRPDEEKLGLIAVLRLSNIKDKKEGFIFKPFYIKASNTVALTNVSKSKSGKDDEYRINLSVGMSVKSIGKKQESGLPGVFSVGEGVVSIPDVILRESDLNIDKIDLKSDLLPYPRKEKSLVSVAVGITETGDVGIDFDQTEAELKTIKEAIGPAIKEFLAEAFKKEE